MGIISWTKTIIEDIQTIKEKNVEGLSLCTYIIYCIGILSWILYGAYLHSFQMILFNTVSFIFTITILVMIIKNKNKKI